MLELDAVCGIFIIPWLIRYSIPFVKSESCIWPSDQYFALFLIQLGIDCSWAIVLVDKLTRITSARQKIRYRVVFSNLHYSSNKFITKMLLWFKFGWPHHLNGDTAKSEDFALV